MPRVHLVASLLKRWLIGTHQGGVQHQHLDYYLDEFTFRFNRRRSKARGLLFHRLAQQALAVGPAPYNAIVKHRVPADPQQRGNEGDTQFAANRSEPNLSQNPIVTWVYAAASYRSCCLALRRTRQRQ